MRKIAKSSLNSEIFFQEFTEVLECSDHQQVIQLSNSLANYATPTIVFYDNYDLWDLSLKSNGSCSGVINIYLRDNSWPNRKALDGYLSIANCIIFAACSIEAILHVRKSHKSFPGDTIVELTYDGELLDV